MSDGTITAAWIEAGYWRIEGELWCCPRCFAATPKPDEHGAWHAAKWGAATPDNSMIGAYPGPSVYPSPDSFVTDVAHRSPCCWRCVPNYRFMLVCPECGNKRCPRANDHDNTCTGSNEPGQPGSAYPAIPLSAKGMTR